MVDTQNPDVLIPHPQSTRPLEVDTDPFLTELQKVRKLLEKAAGLPPFLRVLEATLTTTQSVVFTIDAPFDMWCIYNTCDTGGFIRIGANMQSVPLLGSLYLGRNGKVIFPATARQTAVLNNSTVTVSVFAVAFNRAFDIFF